MEQYYIALALACGLIVGYLAGSVMCLYVIKFLSGPPKTKKNIRKKYTPKETAAENVDDNTPDKVNPIKERFSRLKGSTWTDKHCASNDIDRRDYLRDAMLVQENGYRYKIDRSTEPFVRGTRYSQGDDGSADAIRNMQETEKSLLQMAVEANRQMNDSLMNDNFMNGQ